MGKGSRLFTAGWGRDGKVGSRFVDGTEWEYTISWWDGTGRDREAGREIGREPDPDMFVVVFFFLYPTAVVANKPQARHTCAYFIHGVSILLNYIRNPAL